MKVLVRETAAQRLLSKVATRLAQLLKASDDPKADREEVIEMLRSRNLYTGMSNREWNNYEFAMNVIYENEALRESVWAIEHEFNPQASETPGDLVSHLLPGGTLD